MKRMADETIGKLTQLCGTLVDIAEENPGYYHDSVYAPAKGAADDARTLYDGIF